MNCTIFIDIFNIWIIYEEIGLLLKADACTNNFLMDLLKNLAKSLELQYTVVQADNKPWLQFPGHTQ